MRRNKPEKKRGNSRRRAEHIQARGGIRGRKGRRRKEEQGRRNREHYTQKNKKQQ